MKTLLITLTLLLSSLSTKASDNCGPWHKPKNQEWRKTGFSQGCRYALFMAYKTPGFKKIDSICQDLIRYIEFDEGRFRNWFESKVLEMEANSSQKGQ